MVATLEVYSLLLINFISGDFFLKINEKKLVYVIFISYIRGVVKWGSSHHYVNPFKNNKYEK